MKNKIISSILLLVLLLTACEDSNEQADTNNATTTPAVEQNGSGYNQQLQALEKVDVSEESYLFVDQSFTIQFPYAVDFIHPIEKATLLLNGRVVTDLHDPQNTVKPFDKNKLIVKSKTVPKPFDELMIIDKDGNEIHLDTGKYVFGKRLPKDTIPEKQQVYQMGSHYQQMGTKVKMTFNMSNVPGSKITFEVPNELKGIILNPVTKVLKSDSETTQYEYSFTINQPYYEKNKLNVLSFEILAHQQLDGRDLVISKSYIPISADDLKV
ncbi:hypothetical protein [Paenibacillus wulumuqiensis]|uniref:hypothetical protein n=1 Tax=Paenibacillus wulumuqiensis TaxID=1567107 RepID=UPI000619FA91|nr:hypothetical protein [Paenibacillus wulumuqiensis]